jgi:hypothetical protein
MKNRRNHSSIKTDLGNYMSQWGKDYVLLQFYLS